MSYYAQIMKRLNINTLIFTLVFITSCSNSNQENNINSTNETPVVEVEEVIKEPANSIWVSAKKVILNLSSNI